MPEERCAFCGELIEGEPVRQGNLVYCSEACAFEATRSKDCGGRSDSTISHPVVTPTSKPGSLPQ